MHTWEVDPERWYCLHLCDRLDSLVASVALGCFVAFQSDAAEEKEPLLVKLECTAVKEVVHEE